MKAVKIADLKDRLSEHLREVRAGHSLTVLDRNTPVARLVPVESGDDVVVTAPAPGAPPVGKVKLPKLSGGRKVTIDVVAMLLADRRSRA